MVFIHWLGELPELSGTVISAYRFQMFALASQLEQRGVLETLITAMPKRMIGEVGRTNIKSRFHLAMARHAYERLWGYSEEWNRRVISDFDSWSQRILPSRGAVISLSGFATGALLKARSRGQLAICDRASHHISIQENILKEEADSLGLPEPRFDPWLIERELTEYEIADVIVVPSTTVANSFFAKNVGSSKVFVNPYGANLSRFHPPIVEKRGRYSNVLSVANLELRKGAQYLIPAYNEARTPHSTLLLVGSKKDQAFIDILPIESLDTFLLGIQSIDIVAAMMRKCGIYVLTSVEEGLSLSIIQAMASGMAIVATEATGARDVIQDGVNGYVVPDRSIEQISHKLKILLNDPDLCKELGANALQTVQHWGGWNQYGQRYANLLVSGSSHKDN